MNEHDFDLADGFDLGGFDENAFADSGFFDDPMDEVPPTAPQSAAVAVQAPPAPQPDPMQVDKEPEPKPEELKPEPVVVAPAPAPAPTPVVEPPPAPAPTPAPVQMPENIYSELLTMAMQKLNEFRQTYSSGTQFIQPLTMHNTAGILQQLDAFGFAIVEVPQYENLTTIVQNRMQEWMNFIESYDKVQHLFKNFNHSVSRQLNGFGVFDKNGSSYFNMFNMMLELRWLMTGLVPGMQKLITAAAPPNTYGDQHTWLVSSQPPFINERGVTVHKTNNYIQRGFNSIPREQAMHDHKPSREEGQDLMEAIYLSPYLWEYRNNVPEAHMRPYEYLQVFLPMTTIDSEREAKAPLKRNGAYDPNCVNSLRLIPGFHTIYPKLVQWIFENKIDVLTGEISNESSTTFHNPNPTTNCYYRLAPACADLLRSFMVDIPIHNPQGKKTMIIMDPRMNLTVRFVSHCIFFPMAVWPHLNGTGTPKEQADFTTLRENDVNLGRISISTDTEPIGDNIFYKYLRRAYFDHFTPQLLRRNQQMVMTSLNNALITPLEKHYSKTWKQCLIHGFPNTLDAVARDEMMQQELAYNIQARIPTWESVMTELLNLLNAPDSRDVDVVYHPTPQFCHQCNSMRDLLFECEMVDELEKNSYTFHYCADCIVQLEAKIDKHVQDIQSKQALK